MGLVTAVLQGCDAPDGNPATEASEAPQIEITLEEALQMAEDLRPLPTFHTWGGTKDQIEPELLFASNNVQTEQGELVAAEYAGDLTPAQRQRLARPYTHMDEPWIHITEAWTSNNGDGLVERGYRAMRVPNPHPVVPQPSQAPLEIRAEVVQAVSEIAKEDPEQLVDLDLEIRDFPEWDIPLPPDVLFLSQADVSAKLAERQAALDARKALAGAMAAPIIETVQDLGGEVTNLAWKAGWVQVRVPAAAFPILQSLPSIERIDGEWGKGGGPAAPMSIGTTRDGYYQGADRFLNAGYDGKEPNPARHAYGRITIGMLEPDGYESGACAFMNGPDCSGGSRVRQTFRCDNSASNRCLPGTVHTGNNSLDGHGTWTTSIALADYTDGQANGRAMGDSNWTNDTCSTGSQCASGICEGGKCAHSPEWENRRTGMAPEAFAVLFGRAASGAMSSSFTDMFDDAVDLQLDITNSSWTWGSTDCSLSANTLLEQEIEIAYDDGVFTVHAAGNDDGDDATSCTIREPVTVPKNFAVNAYDADDPWCQLVPSRYCRLDRNSCEGGKGCSARGGATAITPIGTYADAVSIVDLVAPSGLKDYTAPTSGTEGIPGTSPIVGTSMAAPFVAGAAALVKDQYLANGQSWVNDPGVLHTLMLAMGDRHFSTDPSGTAATSQLAATPDKWYGLGRLRMRLLENGQGMNVWANYFGSFTFSYCGQNCGGGVVFYPFGTSALPSSVRLAKCVLHQVEDMSSKGQVSRLTLEMRVFPVGGGGAVYTRISSNADLKKVTAIEGNVFGGNYIAMTLWTNSVTTAGVTARINCYISDIQDDATQ